MTSLRSWMVNTSSECSQYLFGCMLTGTGVYIHWYWSVNSLRPQCKLIATDYDTVKNQTPRRAMCISLHTYQRAVCNIRNVKAKKRGGVNLPFSIYR